MTTPGVIVLDGGLSTALEERGQDLSSALWTARLLRDAPDEIGAAHRFYYAAGARIATTASYQASVAGFVQLGVAASQAAELVTSSVTIARRVRDELAGDGIERFVAASVGPYGAVLGDGSEYRGHYGLSAQRLREFHGPRMELLAIAGPDLFAIETIPDIAEAEVIVALLDQFEVPAWVSYSIEAGRTRAGQPLTDAFAVAAGSTQVIAVGVNCCAPADVSSAVTAAVTVTGLPAVAYPNRGESWDADARGWTGSGVFDPQLAQDWVAAGARYVGGCCRVGPADIAALARSL